jgi:hypothetical protein
MIARSASQNDALGTTSRKIANRAAKKLRMAHEPKSVSWAISADRF